MNILRGEEDMKPTFWDKVIHKLFIKIDEETGALQVRDSALANRIVSTYYRKKSEKHNQNSPKFSLESVIEYPKKFAEKYKSENRVFVINICSEHIVELQLVHPSINSSNTEVNEFGYSIYLPFAHTTSEGIQELESFKSRSYFTEFEKSDDSEMESYYCNCKEDYGKLENLVRSILSDIKGFKISDEIYITHFFS